MAQALIKVEMITLYGIYKTIKRLSKCMSPCKKQQTCSSSLCKGLLTNLLVSNELHLLPKPSYDLNTLDVHLSVLPSPSLFPDYPWPSTSPAWGPCCACVPESFAPSAAASCPHGAPQSPASPRTSATTSDAPAQSSPVSPLSLTVNR